MRLMREQKVILELPDMKPSLNRSGLLVVWGIGVINSLLTVSFLVRSGFGYSIALDPFTLFIWLLILILAFGELYNTNYRKHSIIIVVLSIGVILLLGLMILRNLDIIPGYLTPRDPFVDWSFCLLAFGSSFFVIGLFYHSLRKHEDRHESFYSIIVISFLLVGLYGVLAGYDILTSSLSFPEFGYLSSSLTSLFFAIKIVPCTLALIADADVLLIQKG